MFDEHVRRPIQTSDLTDDEKAERLVDAFRTLLPTVTTLVANHFRSVLLEVAQEHLEAVGDPSELAAAREEPGWERALVSAPVLGRDGALPQGDAKHDAVEGMFDRLAPRYDRMNRIISLGLDRRWRRRTVDALGAAPGARVLDLACGTGDLCRDLATRGCDARRPRLLRRHARRRTRRRAARARRRRRAPRRRRRARRRHVRVRAAQLRRPRRGVRASAHGVLRAGGRFAALDATVPTNPVMRAGNAVWFRGAVPLLGRVLAHDAEAYRYLPKSTAYLPPHAELGDAARDRRVPDVRHTTLTGGSVLLLTGTRS